MKEHKINLIRKSGVVGAGGAGFPSYVKFSASAGTIIANGAECEPLLECDRHLLLSHGKEVISGITEGMKLTGAHEAFLAIKNKHKDLAAHLEILLQGTGIKLALLPDIYPMGDEQVLIHQVTGKLIPPGEIPLAKQTVVSNVMTFYNIHRALNGQPVTDRDITVNGFVQKPFTTKVPLGTSFGELIKAAGGYTKDGTVLIAGGPMTGFIASESDTVTKTTGGLLALSSDSTLVKEKLMSIESTKFQAKAACFQCRDCTRVCPRWQLGSPLQPHLIMRAVNYSANQKNEVLDVLKTAHYCCECGLCATIGCQTMRLSPRKICASLKKEVERPSKYTGDVTAQNIRLEDYQVPSSRLLLRYGLSQFGHTDFKADLVKPSIVSVLLKQHIGSAAISVVRVGDNVKKGTLIAQEPDKGLSAPVHAPIDGNVTYVSDDKVVIAS